MLWNPEEALVSREDIFEIVAFCEDVSSLLLSGPASPFSPIRRAGRRRCEAFDAEDIQESASGNPDITSRIDGAERIILSARALSQSGLQLKC
jgi:hypothetical protein